MISTLIPISSLPPGSALDHHKSFIEWAQTKRGVEINGVDAAEISGAGIGVVATRDIRVSNLSSHCHRKRSSQC